jgi:hypothetical protein
MRCVTCANTLHPGYVVWRGRDVRGRAPGGTPFYGSLIPCPDCAGSLLVSACEGERIYRDERIRPYRYYSLDERGMIFLAEITDGDSDDEALVHAEALLGRHVRCQAVEVWDRRRAVHVARRLPQSFTQQSAT